jgi:hypothetical protein
MLPAISSRIGGLLSFFRSLPFVIPAFHHIVFARDDPEIELSALQFYPHHGDINLVSQPITALRALAD